MDSNMCEDYPQDKSAFKGPKSRRQRPIVLWQLLSQCICNSARYWSILIIQAMHINPVFACIAHAFVKAFEG